MSGDKKSSELEKDVALAWVLYRALQTSGGRNALMQGDPGHLRYTRIDGRFNLTAVARRMMAAAKAASQE